MLIMMLLNFFVIHWILFQQKKLVFDEKDKNGVFFTYYSFFPSIQRLNHHLQVHLKISVFDCNSCWEIFDFIWSWRRGYFHLACILSLSFVTEITQRGHWALCSFNNQTSFRFHDWKCCSEFTQALSSELSLNLKEGFL